MTSRERVKTVLEGGIPDRVPIHDGYWDETLVRWQKEGMPAEACTSREAIWDFFDTDIRMISVDSSFQYEEEILTEDSRYVIKRTKDGMIQRSIKGITSTPALLDFPIKTRRDWEELKSRLRVTAGRLPVNLDSLHRKFSGDKRFIVVAVHDPYEASWSKLGPFNLLESMKQDPDLISDVFRTITDLNLMVCEDLLGMGYQIDGAWIWGDIAYSKGTFFSPEMYRKILHPYHRRLIGFFRERGLPVIYHSDGDVRAVIPLLLEAGIRCLQPLEAKANMDLFQLKQQFGKRLVLMGNVDFEQIAKGEDEAEREIRLKVGKGKEGGNYIYHSDHSVPPKVSFGRYLRILELVRLYGSYDRNH